jgi:hypothetical protein
VVIDILQENNKNIRQSLMMILLKGTFRIAVLHSSINIAGQKNDNCYW